MARIFKTPFGAQGDTEQVPEAPQGDGSVSLTQGFGYDYEREYEDPAAKDIRREVMNGLFHDITEAIGDIQLSGIAKWDAAAAPYPAGAVVWHNNAAWMSTAGNNSSEPGTGSWKAVDLSSSIRLSESIDQVPDAETVQEALAALGVLGTNFASPAEAQALTSLTKLLTPGRLADAFAGSNQSLSSNGYQILPGGLIIQWGNAAAANNGDTVNYPIAFPNNVLNISLTDGNQDINSASGYHIFAYLPQSLSKNNFSIGLIQPSTGSLEVQSYLNWLAIGY